MKMVHFVTEKGKQKGDYWPKDQIILLWKLF